MSWLLADRDKEYEQDDNQNYTSNVLTLTEPVDTEALENERRNRNDANRLARDMQK